MFERSTTIDSRQRLVAVVAAGLFSLGITGCSLEPGVSATPSASSSAEGCGTPGQTTFTPQQLIGCLDALPRKGRAPKTGYSRDQFGDGWNEVDGCDTRNRILQRDLTAEKLDRDGCKVLTGDLEDPYTGKHISFRRGNTTSTAVQIDHVVALSDAWQTGAQQLDAARRQQLANDPLELLAVDGPTNDSKSDGDAATWLPPNRDYRCEYVGRQVLVKSEYHLWVTPAEHDAIGGVLQSCPTETLTIG